jgi:hypothetical protein
MATSPNSSISGFFAPPIAVTSDQVLEDTLHAWLVGVTGLTGDLVRPAWVAEPSNLPDASVDWCAFRIAKRVNEVNTYQSTNATATVVSRNQDLLCALYFYGPSASGQAENFCANVQVAQNREQLPVNMAFITTGDIMTTTELVKNTWYNRADLDFTMRRRLTLVYPILHITNMTAAMNFSVTGTVSNFTQPLGNLTVNV